MTEIEPIEVDAPAPPVSAAPPLVTFWVQRVLCGLRVETVREVVRVEQITRVPHAPRQIRGLAPLRGRPIPVIDAGAVLGGEPIAIDAETRILILDAPGRPIGLLVSAAAKVTATPAEEVRVLELDQLLELP